MNFFVGIRSGRCARLLEASAVCTPAPGAHVRRRLQSKQARCNCPCSGMRLLTAERGGTPTKEGAGIHVLEAHSRRKVDVVWAAADIEALGQVCGRVGRSAGTRGRHRKSDGESQALPWQGRYDSRHALELSGAWTATSPACPVTLAVESLAAAAALIPILTPPLQLDSKNCHMPVAGLRIPPCSGASSTCGASRYSYRALLPVPRRMHEYLSLPHTIPPLPSPSHLDGRGVYAMVALQVAQNRIHLAARIHAGLQDPGMDGAEGRGFKDGLGAEVGWGQAGQGAKDQVGAAREEPHVTLVLGQPGPSRGTPAQPTLPSRAPLTLPWLFRMAMTLPWRTRWASWAGTPLKAYCRARGRARGGRARAGKLCLCAGAWGENAVSGSKEMQRQWLLTFQSVALPA